MKHNDSKEKIEKLKRIVEESDNIVFFGGAGVSTESGVPDFRSKDGLYNQRDIKFEKYTPEFKNAIEQLSVMVYGLTGGVKKRGLFG